MRHPWPLVISSTTMEARRQLCRSLLFIPFLPPDFPCEKKEDEESPAAGGGSSTPWMTDSIFGELEREREREIGGGGSHVIYTNNTSGHV